MDKSQTNDFFSNLTVVIIAGLILAVALGGFFWFKNKYDSNMEGAQKTIDSAEAAKYTDYEGRIIPGSKVRNLLSTYEKDEICVTVKTKKNTTSYNYADKTLATAIDPAKNRKNIVAAGTKTEKNYINPAGEFLCSIGRDDNQSLVEIIFEQQ